MAWTTLLNCEKLYLTSLNPLEVVKVYCYTINFMDVISQPRFTVFHPALTVHPLCRESEVYDRQDAVAGSRDRSTRLRHSPRLTSIMNIGESDVVRQRPKHLAMIS